MESKELQVDVTEKDTVYCDYYKLVKKVGYHVEAVNHDFIIMCTATSLLLLLHQLGYSPTNHICCAILIKVAKTAPKCTTMNVLSNDDNARPSRQA